ncbi:MAG: sensor histidine kinase N-terminal domain-containing protein [Rhodocyclales bacterium]|nr:sensor histidine kinase N-terminal domain-containing protein [Rhodocyclales bacterium]
MISLRRRLIVLMLGVFALAWGVLTAIVFWDARREIHAFYDDRLEKIAEVLLELSWHELIDEHETPEEVLNGVFSERLIHAYDDEAAFQIWYRGHLLVRTANAPAAERFISDGSFADRPYQEQMWRVLHKTHPDGPLEVYVGEPFSGRTELIYHVIGQLIGPLLVALPLLVILVLAGVRRGLQPLVRTECEIAHRSPAQLTPIALEEVPLEICGIVGELNHLLEALAETMARERRFTSHAAHELRTPLAVLKTQAQLALRTPEGPQREEALHRLLAGVDRASRLVSQLLTLTRLEPDVTRTLRGKVDLREITREALAELAPLALERDVELGLDAPEPAPVHGIALGLGILVRNLIDNAIHHSPINGRVDVQLVADATTVTLTVSDQGPGIPPEERARVFEPFYRVPGSPTGGAGLGLAIVQRIVAFHGGRVDAEAGPDGHGTTMRVVLPRADVSPSNPSLMTETP